VELFEQLRREYEFGVGTIRGVAQTFGVHRRLVREAVVHAPPPARKKRQRPRLDPAIPFIDAILAADRQAPRKQHHSAHRILHRRQAELPACRVAESTVREYVREPKRALGLLGRATGVPQSYAWRGEAQVDGYEAVADVEGARQTLQGFGLRSTASGGAFHRAYPHATQQAFLEAHEAAFRYFGGVFHRLRSDNMPLAVKRIRRGRKRGQTTRVLACRSHWRFAAEFCSPAEPLGPDPAGRGLAALNAQRQRACEAEPHRTLAGRAQPIGAAMQLEGSQLLPLAAEGFALAEVSFPRVDGCGCVKVCTNAYSVPVRVGAQVEARGLRPRWKSGTPGTPSPGMPAATAASSRCSTSSTTWMSWSRSPAPWRGPRHSRSGAPKAAHRGLPSS
jgi:transposase